MKKTLALSLIFLILIINFSCKKEVNTPQEAVNGSLKSRNGELSLKQKRKLSTTEGYIFDWANGISLEENLNADCSDQGIFLDTDGNESLYIPDQIYNAGGAPAIGVVASTVPLFGYYPAAPDPNQAILVFEVGANSDIDDYCECIIAHSPTPFVKKDYY